MYLFNPKTGAPIKIGYRREGDTEGFFHTIGVGETVRCEPDAGKFLLHTHPFLVDVTKEIEKASPEEKARYRDSKTELKVPNLIDRRLHPEKYEDEEVQDPSFYGPGIETDRAVGFEAPRSKFLRR